MQRRTPQPWKSRRTGRCSARRTESANRICAAATGQSRRWLSRIPGCVRVPSGRLTRTQRKEEKRKEGAEGRCAHALLAAATSPWACVRVPGMARVATTQIVLSAGSVGEQRPGGGRTGQQTERVQTRGPKKRVDGRVGVELLGGRSAGRGPARLIARRCGRRPSACR